MSGTSCKQQESAAKHNQQAESSSFKNHRVRARESMYLLVLLTFPGIYWPQTLSPPPGTARGTPIALFE
jgi:hypothetical protein